MNTPKYKLLVLTDLSKASNIALENAINLSKVIGGSIDVFHVSKPSDVAEYENQYSAMRSIDEERMNKKAQLKKLARKVAQKFNIKINTSTILGNLKDETLERIEKTNPDIVVLGKRSAKLVNFLGDGFTKFILDKFNGSVLISGKEKAMSPSEIMSLGMLNTTADELQVAIAQDLRKYSKNPIKRFSVRSSSEKNIEKTVAKAENVITYEFENGSNAMNTIASYVEKNNIGLLCMNQHSKKNTRFKSFASNIKEAIHKINVPILIVKNNAAMQLQ